MPEREREGVAAELDALAGLARRWEAASSALALDELARRVRQDRFRLLVVGQFKRGKSTLVNALLGEEVLPAGVLPLTSVPTEIVAGEEPEARIRYQDGREERVGVERLTEFVSEVGNPSNRKGVAAVEVRYPAPLLRRGVVIVDTPGVGSTVEANTQAAREAVESADAALAVLGSDPPLTREEAEYLRDVTARAAHVLYVQNKVDTLGAGELEQVLAFHRRLLAEVAGEAGGREGRLPRILPVSARRGLLARQRGDAAEWEASGMAELERELEHFLAEERGSVFATSIRRQVERRAGALRLALEIRRAAFRTPVEELDRRRARLRERLEELERRREDDALLFRRDVDRLVAGMEEALGRWRREAEPALEGEIEAWLEREGRAGRRLTVREVEEEVSRRLGERLEAWREAESREVGRAYAALAERFAGRFQTILDELLQTYGEYAAFRPDPIPADPEVVERPDFYFQLSEIGSWLPGLNAAALARWLPAAWALPALKARARERLRELMELNSGRLRADLAQRLRESARRLAGRLALRLDGLRAELEAALRSTEAALGEASGRSGQEEARLEEALSALEEHLARLGGVLSKEVEPDGRKA
ncbi:MAG: dynamin family protein [Bacillota bacterium]|nr:dynamin family protein [Bacillota bacterium]